MTTTLDPSNKSSLIALSGANLIASGSGMTGSGNNKSVYSVDVLGIDKGYFECTFTTTDITHQEMGMGIGNPSNGVNTWVGASTTSCGELNFENIFLNGSNIGKSGSTGMSNGDTLDCAYNLTANLIWFRRNNGNWNNAAIGSQNPNGNVGGLSISGIGANSALKIMVTLGATANVITMRIASTDWTHTAPTGYTEVNPSTGRTATGAMTTDAATMSGAGAVKIQATGAITTGAAVMAGAGALKIQATGAMNTDAAVMNATGQGPGGSMAVTTGAAVMAGVGALKIQSTAAMVTGAAVMTAAAYHADHVASAAMVTGAAVMAASASLGPVPENKFRYQLPDFKETDVAKLVRHLRNAMTGSSLANDTVTLTPSTTTTVVNADWLRGDDVVLLMPTTASAKTAMVAGYYITTAKGTFTITHASNAATDQTFRWFSAGG